jgi:hypothetical protein
MVKKLRNLFISEVSLVDKGANRHARITLFKRDVPQSDDVEDLVEKKRTRVADPFEDEPGRRGRGPKDFDRLNFNASGVGPATEALWVRFDNLRRQKGPAQGGSAFQEAWSELTDTEKQAVRDEEIAAEVARKAKADAEEKERLAQMNKHDEVMVKAAHAISAGTIENTVRKSTWHAELRKLAAARQEDGETIERTVARLVQTDADARALFKASINGVADDAPMALVTPAPVLKQGTAYARLHDIGAGFMAADPKLTRAQAFAKAFDANPELAQRSKTESVFA